MPKKAAILPLDVVENWGLDFHIGNALTSIHSSTQAQDSNEQVKYLRDAAESILRKVDGATKAKLRKQWKKAKVKQRTKKSAPATSSTSQG